MNAATQAKLIALNRQFYQTFALQFSATRQSLQPGVLRALQGLPARANVLDLGCGNGALARELARRGHQGPYIGLDFSPELLAEARKLAAEPLTASFLLADLSSPDWVDSLQGFRPDVVLAFAVLHHLPGADLRRRFLASIHDLMEWHGTFIFSVWQFLESPRWRARILPWERAGILPEEVGPADYLLDWRSGGYGLRYVHHFDREELADLARRTGFSPNETYVSDGRNGKLGYYQFWQCC